MGSHTPTEMFSNEQIEPAIRMIYNKKVILEENPPTLQGVETFNLKMTVKCNFGRFHEDNMLQLYKQEFELLISQVNMSCLTAKKNQHYENLMFQDGTLSSENGEPCASILKSQFTTLKQGRGQNLKYLPYAFSEQGISMLSSVLKSPRGVQVNIAIMRAFVKMRGLMQSQEVIRRELQALKRKHKDHDEKISAIFLMIDEIIAVPLKEPKKRKIGFMREGEE